jgi:hypothetical protein
MLGLENKITRSVISSSENFPQKNMLTITEDLLAMENSRNLRIPNTQLVAVVRHLTCFGRRGPEPRAPVRS